MSSVNAYSHQSVGEEEVAAVAEVLRSEYLTQGPRVADFEERLAATCGAQYAVAFCNGTAALHAAYFAAGLHEGDELITSPLTFLATANAALYLGARPVFVDIEPDTGNMDAARIEAAVTPKTKAIAPVHFAGHPVDLDAVAAVALRHNLLVIDDACHALGATYKGAPLGNGAHADMTVLSFHPVKSITTGEGGAVLTRDAALRDRLRAFRGHGVVREREALRHAGGTDGAWYYEMQELGFNYRFTDIQAALGLCQLEKLPALIAARRAVAAYYGEALGGNPHVDTPVERPYARSAWHLYPLRLGAAARRAKPAIFDALRARGMGVQVHYIPVHRQPYYRDLGYDPAACPAAQAFYEAELSIPLHPLLTRDETRWVVDTLDAVLQEHV